MAKTLAKPSLRAVKGLAVAIVGRAWYLAESGLGPEIDGADFVVRINWTLPIDAALVPNVGSRTDLLYTMQKPNRFHRAAALCGVPSMPLNARLRGGLAVCADPMLTDSRGYIPNTGTVAIFDALAHGAKEVRAYGFDLHASTRYADTGATHDNRVRYAGQRERGTTLTHDPELDRWLLRGLQANPRFKPDAVLAGVLA